jgi:hypothetical protein
MAGSDDSGAGAGAEQQGFNFGSLNWPRLNPAQ